MSEQGLCLELGDHSKQGCRLFMPSHARFCGLSSILHSSISSVLEFHIPIFSIFNNTSFFQVYNLIVGQYDRSARRIYFYNKHIL